MNAIRYMIGPYNPDTLGTLPVPTTAGRTIPVANGPTAIECAKDFNKNYCNHNCKWPLLITFVAGFGQHSTWKIGYSQEGGFDAAHIPPEQVIHAIPKN
jgi:hypothetical protein